MMNHDVRPRTLTALLLISVGVVWLFFFPKKASLNADMVLSVAIAVSFLGTGVIVWLSDRMTRSASVLSALLLWSLSANAYLFAWQHQAGRYLLSQMHRAIESPAPPVLEDH